MIVTIDGPAGAGKSYVSRALAERLGFQFLDTGATYRAVALTALRQKIDWHDEDALVRLSQEISIEFQGPRVIVNGEDVTDDIRTTEVTTAIHFVADNPLIRKNLVELQRRIAADQNTVTEGRDQGTVAFPDAECKIFLTASPEERARRRLSDLVAQGEQVTFEEVLAQQNERDRRDSNREVGRLMKALDAIEVMTDGLTRDEVVNQLERLMQAAKGFKT